MSYENPRNLPGERPQKIEVSGDSYVFVRGQRGDASAIYKSTNAFMRIGKTDKIARDLAIHKKMEQAGFPVAKLISEGELDGQSYFIETSLGDNHLGEVFAQDVEQGGSIDSQTFDEFVSLAEAYAEAQIRTDNGDRDANALREGILLEALCEEMPTYAEKLQERFEEVQKNTKNLPSVLTHGDFNPNNLYREGVIDLEDSFYAPYGYDLVSAITHINYFPDSQEYEYFAKYRFTVDQQRKYFERLDAVSQRAGLVPLSPLQEDFEFCRAVWLAAKIPHVPKLQKFRFDMVVEKFLS